MNKLHKGYSLIELMIGVTIGLFGMLAVSQVFVTFNQQRTTSTQTMEAQSNGVMALYLMERDLAQSGYGLMSMQSCEDGDAAVDSDGDGTIDNDQDIHWYYAPAGCTTSCGLQTSLSTKPVSIVVGTGNPADGIDVASDTILVQYAKASSGAPGATVLTAQAASSAELFQLASVAGFAIEDIAVANVANSCTLFQVTNVNTVDRSLAHITDYTITVSGVTENRTSAYNPAALPAAPGWETAAADSLIVNLGALISRRYSLSADGVLQMQGYTDTTPATLVEGIVYMKAQYGLNNAGGSTDKSVDLWTTDLTTITTAGKVDYSKVLAVRVGVVARSPLYEKDAVDAPTTLTVLPEILDAGGVTIGAELTYTVPDDHFRYKVYSTIIPLRNVIWGG